MQHLAGVMAQPFAFGIPGSKCWDFFFGVQGVWGGVQHLSVVARDEEEVCVVWPHLLSELLVCFRNCLFVFGIACFFLSSQVLEDPSAFGVRMEEEVCVV